MQIHFAKKAYGCTLHQYLLQERINYVERMLITTDEPITQIAKNSGFSTVARFNSTFLKFVGCTPSEYRKTMCLWPKICFQTLKELIRISIYLSKSGECVQQSVPHREQISQWPLTEGIECSFAAKLHLTPWKFGVSRAFSLGKCTRSP